MNMNNLLSKITQNADWLAGIASVWERFDGDFGAIQEQLTKGAFVEIQRTLGDLNLLKYKLLDSDHLYSGLFKISLLAYLGAEVGIVPNKYKTLAKKVLTGAGIAAVILPGSGPSSPNSSAGSNKNSSGYGY